MTFDIFLKKVSDVKGKAVDVFFHSAGQMGILLDEYKRAVKTLEAFGFSMGKIRVTANPLPEISTSIRGSLHTLDTNKINELLEAK